MSNVVGVICGKSWLRRAGVIALGGALVATGSQSLVASRADAATPQAPATSVAANPSTSVVSGPVLPVARKRNAVGLAFSKSTVTKNSKAKAKVYLTRNYRKASAKVRLQVKKGKSWRTIKTVSVKRGYGSYTFKATATGYYRTVYGKLKSPTRKLTVRVSKRVPSSFTVTGSGFGHGIGMAQYGAYYLALQGRSVESILATYYKGASVGHRPVPGDTRVQLYQASGSDVYVKNGRVRLSGAGLAATGAVYAAGSTIKLRAASGGKVDVWRGSTKLGTVPAGSTLAIEWENTRYFPGAASAVAYVRKAGSTSSATHGYYRYGRFEVTNISGKVNIVNVLKTNTEYLYGLGEMPSLWGKGKGSAALQAQAVAARNYALINSSRKGSCDCNVYDDTRSQYFSGFRKEDSLGGNYWRAAVDATVSGSNGKVMTVGGTLVQGYYYSASGGGTLNSEDVWSAKVSYLRSVPDPYSLKAPGNPNVSWTATVSQARARSMFPTLRNVVSMSVSSKYAGGAARTIRAVDSAGKVGYYTAKADTIRGKMALKADWIRSIRAN